MTNVYTGTELGRIINPDQSLVGRRIVFEDNFGTICYVGKLPKSTSIWLGIDWDDPSRGRHDGKHNGDRYFTASSHNSGSFIRPEKVSLGATLEEALVSRYVLCIECQLANKGVETTVNMVDDPPLKFNNAEQPGKFDAFVNRNTDPIMAEYSGSLSNYRQSFRVELFTTPASDSQNSHENCGPSGVEKRLKSLRSASLSLVPVFRALRGGDVPERSALWPLPGGTLGQILPNLNNLQLSKCLLTKWTEIAEICTQIPWLKSLDVSSNRLRFPCSSNVLGLDLFDNDKETELRLRHDMDANCSLSDKLFHTAFPSLNKLVLVRCSLIDWPGLIRILTWTPSLTSLSAAYNDLGSLEHEVPDEAIHIFRQLTELDLTATNMSDVTQLFDVIGPSSTLTTLFLDENRIAKLPTLPVDTSSTDTEAFPFSLWLSKLNVIGLRDNAFSSWDCMKELVRLPKLTHLLFLSCPILSTLSVETGRQEMIARLPLLLWLNKMEISPEERRGAELDYLKRYGTAWWQSNSSDAKSCEPNLTGDHNGIVVSSEFAYAHPVFKQLCVKWGPPETGESKLITKSIKEGLITVKFVHQKSTDVSTTESNTCVISDGTIRRIPERMTVGHLRMMARRLLRLPPTTVFDLIARGSRHLESNNEVELDADTREVSFYNLEDNDIIYVRCR